MKVVINNCYGGFNLSKACIQRLFELQGKPVWIEDDPRYPSLGIMDVWTVAPEDRVEVLRDEDFRKLTINEREEYNKNYNEQTWYDHCLDRTDPFLVQAVEELGTEAASGKYAKLKVVEIPDDVKFVIEEYDGIEHIAEVHRTWC